MAEDGREFEADEVTDTSNWEQLGLVLWYMHSGEPTEKLVEYIELDTCTGAAISSAIVKALTNMGLDPQMCRSHTYDGAGNMAGRQNGCAKNFQQVSPRALYLHCASHELNLALTHASKVPEIYNMVCDLKSVGIFFKYSPKWQRRFEKSIVIIEKRNESDTDAGQEDDRNYEDSMSAEDGSDDEEYEENDGEEEEEDSDDEEVELREIESPKCRRQRRKSSRYAKHGWWKGTQLSKTFKTFTSPCCCVCRLFRKTEVRNGT